MRNTAIRCLCALAFVAGQASTQPARTTDPDVVVHVVKQHLTFEVTFEFSVAATAMQAWGVLTDYEHMTQFISNMDSSQVVSRNGNRIEVEQRSHANVGLLHISLNGLREVDLTPYTQIRSHLIKGDLKMSDFTTEIIDEGAMTRVKGYGKVMPSAWIAWAVGVDAVQAQTRRQYQELRNEILRRNPH